MKVVGLRSHTGISSSPLLLYIATIILLEQIMGGIFTSNKQACGLSGGEGFGCFRALGVSKWGNGRLYRPAGGCPPSMKLKRYWHFFPCVATGWEKSHRPPVFVFYFGKCQMQSKRAVNTLFRHFIRFGCWFKWHIMNEHEKKKKGFADL